MRGVHHFSLALLHQVAEIYNARSILVCVGDDSDYDLTHLPLSNFLWNFQPEDRMLVALESASADQDVTLVACSLSSEGGLLKGWIPTQRAGAFGKDTVWFTADSDVVDALPLSLTSNVVTFNKESEDTLALHERYRVKGRPRSTFLGRWNVGGGGGLAVARPAMWERRSNLSGVTLRNTLLEWNTLTNVVEGEDPSGFMADVLRVLQLATHFDTTWSSPEDGEWGVLKGESDWSGMVGELARREVDLCTAGLTVTKERSKVVDFTVSVVEDVKTLFRVRGHGRGGTRVHPKLTYVSLFRSASWAAVSVVVVAVATVATWDAAVAVNFRMSWKSVVASLLRESFNCCKLLLRLDSDARPTRKLARKVLFMTSSALSYLLYTCYCTNLIASMTAGGKALIRSYEDVIRHDYDVIIFPGTADEELFKQSPEGSAARRVYEDHSNLECRAVYDSYECALTQMAADRKLLAYLTLLTAAHDGRFSVVTEFRARRERLALGLQMDSELLPLLNYQLAKMRQAGILDEIEQRWLRTPSYYYYSAGRDGEEQLASLGLGQLSLPIVILTAGMVGSILAAIVEKYRPQKLATRMIRKKRIR